MPHRRPLASLLLVIACGPKASSEDGGTSTADTTEPATTEPTTTTPNASSGITTTSTTTEPDSATADTEITSTSTDETGVTCPPPEQYYAPGCDKPSPSNATIEPGCYIPCDERSPCETGSCLLAWIDPCYAAPCGACGGEQGLCLDDLPTGSPCGADEHCTSGVCWDFNHYDPCCFGTVCSGPCETDAECILLAEEAEAPDPSAAQCGPDGRCELMGAGLGSFACAGPMCG